MPLKDEKMLPIYGQETFSNADDMVADGNISVKINVELRPFGQVAIDAGYAHPDRFPQPEEPASPETPVMPLMSSAITPGFARPVSV
jgi:hypothetical protein